MILDTNKKLILNNNKITIINHTSNPQKLSLILNKKNNINENVKEVLIEKKGNQYDCLDCFEPFKIIHIKRLAISNLDFDLFYLDNNQYLLQIEKNNIENFYLF